MQWNSWLMHRATNRKVAGSISDGVIGIFDLNIPSGCTMYLVSTRPLIEMSTRNNSRGQRRPLLRAYNLTTFMCRFLEIQEPELPAKLRACPSQYRDCFALLI